MADQKAENAALVKKTQQLQMEMAPDQVNISQVVSRKDNKKVADHAPREPGVMDEQFPTAGLTAYDKRDKVMEARLALQDDPAQPGMTKFGKLEARDSDFKWLQKKQAAEEAAAFQTWFAKEFDHMAPAQKKRAKELFPEFYSQRKSLLKQQSKNLFDMARIKLDGIESKEDLVKTYMAETGRLDLGPMQNILHPEGDETLDSKAAYQRGLMNPFTVFGKQALPETVATRGVTQNQYAGRQYNADGTINLGITSGLPPFATANPFGNGGDKTNQADKAWYNLLSGQ